MEIRFWKRDTSEARGQSSTEVLGVHLLLQRIGRARVDVVPDHEEVLKNRVEIRISLTIFFIMESFELQTHLVNPRTTLLHGQRVIQLSIESEHV